MPETKPSKTSPKSYYLGKDDGDKERRIQAIKDKAAELGYGNASEFIQAIADGQVESITEPISGVIFVMFRLPVKPQSIPRN